MKETSIIILLCLFAISTYSNGEVYCTDPVLLTELNSTSGNAVYPHLARDGVTLYFGHRDESGTRQLYTATRDLETGVFSNITQISELASGDSLYTPWVSDDGLRLYYGEHYEAIRLYQAERNTISDPWEKKIYFSNVHQYGHNDAVPSLTSDELTMYFASARDGADDMYIWKAIRQAVNEQFVSPVKVNELVRGYRVSCPCILPDGLTIYYAEYSDNGYSDLFRATRSSLDELFSNIEPLSVNLPNQHDAFPYVTPDESELFFWTEEGIWNAQIVKDPWEECIKQIQKAIEHDQNALDEIEKALSAKYKAMEELDKLLEAVDDYSGLTKSDVLKSLAKLRMAINAEENSKQDIQRSIEALEAVLELLNP